MAAAVVERRYYPRSGLRGQVAGWIGSNKVSPLDLSAGGVQVEHFGLTRPGTVTFLTLFFPHHEITLKCKVVRSVVDRMAILDTGEREIIYRTGLEFVNTSEHIRRIIGEYISTFSYKKGEAP